MFAFTKIYRSFCQLLMLAAFLAFSAQADQSLPVIPAAPIIPPPPAITNAPINQDSNSAKPASQPVTPVQQTNAPLALPPAGNQAVNPDVTALQTVTVVGKMDQAGSQVAPDIGASAYTISAARIESQSQGDNASFSQLILRAPGVAEDSSVNGDLHVRGEHANLEYRINNVLLPEGISGLGVELDPRFVSSLQLITGALPARYGFRTAGVVDIQTKSGDITPTGEIGIYGGSYDTIRPSFEYGGSDGRLTYFVDGSYDHNGIGIENTTGSSMPIHDYTDQYKTFLYASYTYDPSSRLIAMAGISYSDFEIPNLPGAASGSPSPTNASYGSALANDGLLPSGTFNSANLNENQNEQNYFAVLSYQKTQGNLELQISGTGRESEQHFLPDPVGDLYLNGVASEEHRLFDTGALQGDASYQLGEFHTVRAGGLFLAMANQNNTSTTAFDLDAAGDPGALVNIQDNHAVYGLFEGLYLEDEWKIFPTLTLNFGGRFDVFSSSFDDENQLSPRANLVYKPTAATTFHTGYSRYFTPPPVESISGTVPGKFVGTSSAVLSELNDPVRAERANYYDAGITQNILPGWTAGVDSYYKTSQNQLDDGLFGQTLILDAFNYERGRIYGLEFSTSFETNGFSIYGNGAYSVAQGENWNSSEYLFNPQDRAYVANHWVYLDHDQRFSGTAGVSYLYKEAHHNSTLSYLDIVSGSGLREDGGGNEFGPGSNPIPNGASVPDYYSLNFGVEQTFALSPKQVFKARLDIVNITDNVYQLRNGTGIGVNAPQYGMRRGIFGSLSYRF